MDIIFKGKINNGKIQLNKPDQFKSHLTSLEDNDIQVIVRKDRKNRTDQQNKYYWGAIIEILGKELGYTPEEMHEALKWQFLKKNGIIPTVRSTTELSTSDFKEYIEKIKIWAAEEMDIFLPDPDEIEV
jgi:hypothetical protein